MKELANRFICTPKYLMMTDYNVYSLSHIPSTKHVLWNNGDNDTGNHSLYIDLYYMSCLNHLQTNAIYILGQQA